MHEKNRIANRYFRWNFTCMCLDGTFSGIGFALLGLSTFMPSIINQIASRYPSVRPIENQLDMLIIVIINGLSSLFGFFTIRYIETLKVRKPLFIILAIYTRVLYFMIAVFIFLMPFIGYRAFLFGLFGTLFLYSLGNGAQVTLWSDMLGRTIPTNKRGMLFAIRDFTGNLLGMLALALYPGCTAACHFRRISAGIICWPRSF